MDGWMYSMIFVRIHSSIICASVVMHVSVGDSVTKFMKFKCVIIMNAITVEET